MDEQRLVKRLLARDEAALKEFFDEYFARLYRFAYARLRGDPMLAEDAAQTALARALRNLASFRGESSLFSWLAQICRNEIADLMEKSARTSAHTASMHADRATQDAAQSVVDQAASVEAHRARGERLHLIREVLDQLPGRYGEMLELKYIEDWNVERIAAHARLSFEATQSQLQRARVAFRAALEARGIQASDLLP